jgi:ketopantoate reductase
MSKITVSEQLILRAFAATMGMDKSATNIRRAKAEVNACLNVSTMIHRENNKHMYDKRVYKGAGEMVMNGVTPVITHDSADIRGPVTINIVNTPKRTRKAAVAA